jgi:hypothetical protein
MNGLGGGWFGGRRILWIGVCAALSACAQQGAPPIKPIAVLPPPKPEPPSKVRAPDPSPRSNCYWVSGYTREDGTYVQPYQRCRD